MIPPRLQPTTVLMFILMLLIILLAAVNRIYWLLVFPYGYLVHQIYYKDWK